MNLWIRSQDRYIFAIAKWLRIIKNDKKRFAVVNYDSAYMMQELGEYSTEERAVEVLDSIDYFMTFKAEQLKDRNIPFLIYQMPKE